ncbi:MAG: diguanylate cyclase [Chloroflexota bacterium]
MNEIVQKADIFETSIASLESDTEKVDALNQLAWMLRRHDHDRAQELCTKANRLAHSREFITEPYFEGWAEALSTSALIYYFNNNLDKALERSFNALQLIEKTPANITGIDARITISLVNLSLGDYATAYAYTMPALQLSRNLNLNDREAHCLDTLALIYAHTNDLNEALQHHLAALQLTREVKDIESEAFVLNNLAVTLFEMGNFKDSYLSAIQSIELMRRLELFSDEIIVATNITKSLVKMKAFEQAESYLQYYVNKVNNNGMSKPYVDIMLGMTQLYFEQKKYSQAENYLHQAFQVALSNNFVTEELICHHLFSQVYEQLGDLPKTVSHNKLYFELREETNRQISLRKIVILNSSHNIELARQEAAMVNAREGELLYEIDERRRVEKLLEELSIHDPLTNLFNSRYFYLLALSEIERSARYTHPLTLIVIDIDDLNAINEKHGYINGDKVIKGIALILKQSLRNSDILCRHGGDEFAILLAETPAEQAMQVAERLRNSIREATFGSEQLIFSVTACIGLVDIKIDKSMDNMTNFDFAYNKVKNSILSAQQNGSDRIITA